MDKSTKNYLKRLISETRSVDMGEMARRPEGKRDEKGKKFGTQTIWKDDNPTLPGQEGTPDAWILNPSKQVGGEKIIIPLDCDEEADFIEKNREWLNSLGVLHELEVHLVACKRVKEKPRNIKTGSPYVPSGEKMEATEKIKRKLYKIVEDNFENANFSEILNKRSIPAIVARDRKNVNQHSKVSNLKIDYSTHNYNGYSSVKDFLAAAIARISGKETPEMKTFYMARQYNEKYNRWIADKKMLKNYLGKTEKYFLDAYGLEEGNLDVTVRMDFEIHGELIGENSFSWNVKLTTKIGKKLSEETGLKGGFLDDKIIQSSKTAQLKPGTVFDDTYTVMDNEEIVNALIDTIDDVKKQVESINPKETLKVANIKRYDINPVNESVGKKFMEKIKKESIK